ncbi:hypothetical protein ACOMHN_038903 [Nucella lapillus]
MSQWAGPGGPGGPGQGPGPGPASQQNTLCSHARTVRHRAGSLWPPSPADGYPPKNALTLITELGSESNAHGLAKIVTSSDTKRKVIWALMVIIGFTAATLQLSLLVRKYLQFQVVELSEIKDSMPVEFPSVTVCNIEPISLRKLRPLFQKPRETELMHWLNFTSIFDFGDQRHHVMSIRAFYENLGNEARNISHDLQDFLVYCQFNQHRCSFNNFTTFFDGNYFNCFTFNGGKRDQKLLMHATGPQNGLSLVISLDNDEPPLGSYGLYNKDSNILHSAGVRVVVHAPNTMPSPVDHGFDIPPGYSSSVGLKAILHTRLSEPYGNCTVDTLAGMKYITTFFSCLQVCKQRIIIARCQCKSSGLPEVPGHNVSFCGVIPDWKDILSGRTGHRAGASLTFQALACEEKVLQELANDRSYEMTCQCYQPCHETTYRKSVSLSYWPLEFYQLHALQLFYRSSSIQQNLMHEAYVFLSQLANMSHLMSRRNDTRAQNLLKQSYTLSEREKSQRASNLIRQNLLRLNIYLEDLSVVEYRQLPAYGLADLFADIGGTLGLWMGISVLTIMELVELVIRLVCLLFNSENQEHMGLQKDEQDYLASYNGMTLSIPFGGSSREELPGVVSESAALSEGPREEVEVLPAVAAAGPAVPLPPRGYSTVQDPPPGGGEGEGRGAETEEGGGHHDIAEEEKGGGNRSEGEVGEDRKKSGGGESLGEVVQNRKVVAPDLGDSHEEEKEEEDLPPCEEEDEEEDLPPCEEEEEDLHSCEEEEEDLHPCEEEEDLHPCEEEDEEEDLPPYEEEDEGGVGESEGRRTWEAGPRDPGDRG